MLAFSFGTCFVKSVFHIHYIWLIPITYTQQAKVNALWQLQSATGDELSALKELLNNIEP